MNNVIHVIPRNDTRLNVELSSLLNVGTLESLAIHLGLETLKNKGKICVGHLVMMKDEQLKQLVGEATAELMRDWQATAIGIPRDAKAVGWRAPTQPFRGF